MNEVEYSGVCRKKYFEENIMFNLVRVEQTKEPIAILTESNELAESYGNYFNSLWKISK